MFGRTDNELPGWFWGGRAASLKPGGLRKLPLKGHPIVLWRTLEGRTVAMDARCAHLGADLSLGKVRPDGLECAFHRWCFKPDGSCPHNRRNHTFAVQERWGHLWVFAGAPEPLFPLPAIEEPARTFHIGPVWMRCHPHLLVANGVDAQHFQTLHGMRFETEPRIETPDPYTVANHMRGRPAAGWLRKLTGTDEHPLQAVFTTVGANFAYVTANVGPKRFAVVFNPRLESASAATLLSQNHMLFFVYPPVLGNLKLMATLLPLLFHDDQKLLESMEFSPGFVRGADDGLIAMAQVVDRLAPRRTAST